MKIFSSQDTLTFTLDYIHLIGVLKYPTENSSIQLAICATYPKLRSRSYFYSKARILTLNTPTVGGLSGKVWRETSFLVDYYRTEGS